MNRYRVTRVWELPATDIEDALQHSKVMSCDRVMVEEI